jgi:hypothetical protein
MSPSTQNVLGRLASRWREWSSRRRTMMALDCCGPAEATRMARDIRVSETDFRALAGRWPGSSDLLSQRMHQINLDASEIARVEPDVTRDLQRVCSCAQARKDAGTISRAIPPLQRGGNIARMRRRLRR